MGKGKERKAVGSRAASSPYRIRRLRITSRTLDIPSLIMRGFTTISKALGKFADEQDQSSPWRRWELRQCTDTRNSILQKKLAQRRQPHHRSDASQVRGLQSRRYHVRRRLRGQPEKDRKRSQQGHIHRAKWRA